MRVQDNGVGMDAETRQRIFDPFFTTKEVGKGTGLGLSTVYGIVQQHDGWIECASEPGRGTTFSIYLPAIDSAGERTSSAAADYQMDGTETILLVEDKTLLSSALKLTLQNYGYTVLESADGEHGLEVFSRQPSAIDLVVLDLSLPCLSGRQLLAQLQEIDPQIKVVIFSGYEAPPEQFPQVQCILQKPVKGEELCRVVRQLLDAN